MRHAQQLLMLPLFEGESRKGSVGRGEITFF
jgi:hypothetical protein